MIFFIFLIVWIAVADSVWHFIIPLATLIVRASYRERNFRELFKISAIIILFFIALFNYIFSESFDRTEFFNKFNWVFFFKLVAFSALMLHEFDNIKRGALQSFPRINAPISMGIRVFSIIKERLDDTWHIYKTRQKYVKWNKQIPLFAYVFFNFILECLIVYREVLLVSFEKGGQHVLDNKTYSDININKIRINIGQKRFAIPCYAIGDIVLLIIILIPSYLVHRGIIQDSISIIVKHITELL
jgi:hypothetical protein